MKCTGRIGLHWTWIGLDARRAHPMAPCPPPERKWQDRQCPEGRKAEPGWTATIFIFSQRCPVGIGLDLPHLEGLSASVGIGWTYKCYSHCFLFSFCFFPLIFSFRFSVFAFGSRFLVLSTRLLISCFFFSFLRIVIFGPVWKKKGGGWGRGEWIRQVRGERGGACVFLFPSVSSFFCTTTYVPTAFSWWFSV